MAHHSPKDDLFKKHYDEIYGLLEEYISSVVNMGDYVSVEELLIGYLIDTYSQVFVGEIDYILDSLGIDMTPQETIEVRNGVNTTDYARSNYRRLKEIFNAHAIDLRSKVLDSDETVNIQSLLDEFKHKIDRIAMSEIQMLIEKASVESAKLFELVTEIKIEKTWNCVGDSKTCPICLAMNGLTIPVTESFSSVAPSVDIQEDLSYTGGDIVYAHPRCRCWVTYSKA
jgi:hypothetical protein